MLKTALTTLVTLSFPLITHAGQTLYASDDVKVPRDTSDIVLTGVGYEHISCIMQIQAVGYTRTIKAGTQFEMTDVQMFGISKLTHPELRQIILNRFGKDIGAEAGRTRIEILKMLQEDLGIVGNDDVYKLTFRVASTKTQMSYAVQCTSPTYLTLDKVLSQLAVSGKLSPITDL